jgi:amino acid adenylation domain-containing protein
VAAPAPLFNSILNYRHGKEAYQGADNGKIVEWFFEKIEGREFLTFEERTNYPLMLSVDDFGEGFRLVAQTLSPVDPQRICEYTHTALEQLVVALETSPTSTLRSLNVLPDAERHQLLVGWNKTEAEFPRHACVQQLFEAQVGHTPERTALRACATTLSYAELDTRATRLAQALRSRGVGRGQRVGLCLERSADMLAAVLGILKAGAAYVPLDPSFPIERLRFMAEDAQLALLVSTSTLAGPFGLPGERQLLLDTDAAAIASQPDQRLTPDASRDARPEDPAYVIYTSGSTGQPKGVVVPHRAVVNFLTSMAREPGLAADDVLVAVTTLSFDIAVLELQLPLTLGATVVIASRDEAMDGRALRALLEQTGATIMQATPVTWRLLIEAGWSGKARFKALVGGEALPKDLADQLLARGVELWNMYGPTETTVWSTCARMTDTAGGITIGKPIANTAVYILDAQKNLCPIGVPGELCIGGDGVTLGYWNRSELTADRYIPDPFNTTPGAMLYRTGDRARWRNDGNLEHLGRLDFQVKIRGYRIELGEIETDIARHPAVCEVVVVAREDVPGDKRLVAYLITQNPPTDLIEQLCAQLRTALPDYMVPAHFVTLKTLPRTLNGKLDRKALPAPEYSGSQQTAYVAPRTATEEVLAEIWANVLNLDRVGRALAAGCAVDGAD